MTATYRIEDTAHPMPEFVAATYPINWTRKPRQTIYACWIDGEFQWLFASIEGARAWCHKRNATPEGRR